MSLVFEHISRIEDVVVEQMRQLQEDGHIKEPDQWSAVNDITIAVHLARKVFERSVNIEKDNQDDNQH